MNPTPCLFPLASLVLASLLSPAGDDQTPAPAPGTTGEGGSCGAPGAPSPRPGESSPKQYHTDAGLLAWAVRCSALKDGEVESPSAPYPYALGVMLTEFGDALDVLHRLAGAGESMAADHVAGLRARYSRPE